MSAPATPAVASSRPATGESARESTAPRGGQRITRAQRLRQQEHQDPSLRFSRASAEAASAGRWDEALRMKDQQLAVVNQQNDGLRANLNRLEAELQVLSDTVMDKERVIHSKERDVQRRDAEIQRIKALDNENKGQEHVLEHAQGQNAKLLRLLEVQEEANRQLKEAKASLEAELATVKRVQKNQLVEAAANETRLQAKLQNLEATYAGLQARWTELNKRHEGFEEHVEAVEKAAAAQVAAMTDELTQRRDQQYVQLERLEDARLQLQKIKDREESTRETSSAVAERSHEVEVRLRDALSELTLREGQIVQMEEAFSLKVKAKDQELDQEHVERLAHERRVKELSEALIKVVEKQKRTQSQCSAREAQIASLRSQLQVLSQDLERYEARAADAEHRLERNEHAREALETKAARLQAELVASVHAEVGSRAAPTTADGRAVDVERQGKRQALRLYLVSVKLTPTLATVTLSDCAIADDDLGDIVKLCSQCSQLERVELRSNLLTDQSTPLLASLLNRPASKVRCLDLQNNLLSSASVQTLAHILQTTMAPREVTSVVVHDSGQIEALADHKLPPSLHVGPNTVALVDVRENYGLQGLSRTGTGTPLPDQTLRPSTQSRNMDRAAVGVAATKRGKATSGARRGNGPTRPKKVADVRQMMLEQVYGDGPGLPSFGTDELPKIRLSR